MRLAPKESRRAGAAEYVTKDNTTIMRHTFWQTFKVCQSFLPTPLPSPKSPKSPTRPTNSKFKIQNSKFKIILYLCPLKGNTTFFEDEYHNKNKIQLS